ncbi:MAG: plasmid stabilization protein, partial [Alphaproteobacteria bacterium]|nr:plasmid stabilization protein [Alphaproteobacteria bacterium]
RTATAATRRKTGTARRRGNGPTRAELYQRARRKGIPGAARMRKAELERALRR